VEVGDTLLGCSDAAEREVVERLLARRGRCQSLSGLPVGPAVVNPSSRLIFCKNLNMQANSVCIRAKRACNAQGLVIQRRIISVLSSAATAA
jgi:hypothetical protein